jgi:hypothetical protein
MSRNDFAQPSLFQNSDRITLVDDLSGHIVYFPSCVPRATADEWFDTLRNDIAWTSAKSTFRD